MPAGDIILDNDNELLIRNGDLVIGDAGKQHAEHIIRAKPGQYRQWPMVGADVFSQLNGNAPEQWLNNLKKQLQADGMQVQRLLYNNTNGELTVNGSY